MRFLITGANGQLGREWSDHLSELKVDFKACSSSELDITDEKVLAKKLDELKPDIIINCAAYTKVDQAEDEQEKAHLVNAESAKNLAEICASKNIKLIHFSTDYIFEGTAEDQQKLPNGYPEDYPTNPQNVYGATKLAGEKAIQNAGCDFIIMRVSWLCGKYGNNFVKTMLGLADQNYELSVVNDQIGCPAFAYDVVQNSIQLINNGETGIFHYCSVGTISWYDFAKEIFNQADKKVGVKPVSTAEFPTKAKRPAFSLLDTQKISNIPGVHIPGWKEGLNNLIEQLNEH